MSATLWVGIVVIVCILEVVRIALSTYVLLHILESQPLRKPGEEPGQATRSLRSASQRARREALLDPTLQALRGAMDEVGRVRRTGVRYRRRDVCCRAPGLAPPPLHQRYG